jgi:transposase-like protein
MVWENRASILRQWLSVHRGISKDNLDTYLSLFQPQGNKNKPPTKNVLRAKKAKTVNIKRGKERGVVWLGHTSSI